MVTNISPFVKKNQAKKEKIKNNHEKHEHYEPRGCPHVPVIPNRAIFLPSCGKIRRGIGDIPAVYLPFRLLDNTTGMVDKVLMVVYTEIGETKKIISARLANKPERRSYHGYYQIDGKGWEKDS
jgi:hypothetical protein